MLIKQKARFWSWTGIVLCVLYAAISLMFIVHACSPDVDDKGRFVALQIPLALQLQLLRVLGLFPLLENLSWFGAYVLLGLPTLVFLYFSGWFLEKIIRRFIVGPIARSAFRSHK
ncbi:hypothetical protein HMPREF3069_33240 [Achromobacter xylosoxidans]|nr:hypothetical protein HMPREF2772_17130 [Achromobacter xylosoxidans]OFS27552.1 hypothetical protein HMPREF3069_33240 [Achromobacter xylosoxidans]